LEKKKKNPQEFEKEINRIKQALDEYKLVMRKTKEDLKSNYSGRHSSWQKDIDKLKAKYPELITESKSVEKARKHTTDALNEVQNRVETFSRELTDELKEVLDKAGGSFQEQYKITIPKVDLDALEKKAKKNAYRKKNVYAERDVDFWDIITLGAARLFRENEIKEGTKKVFDDEKYLGSFKTQCNKAFYDVANDLPNKSKEVLDLYLGLFTNEMDAVINERHKALENEKESKQSNEELIKEIEIINGKKKNIQPEMMRLIEILEDIR
jgi:hypothetical protein